MKRISIFIAMIIIALSASAQSGREKGLVFRPEVGVGLFSVGTFENITTIHTITASPIGIGWVNNDTFLKNEGTLGLAFNLMANLGANLNTNFYMGGGLGLYGNGNSTSMALYANPRIYLGDHKVTFFFDIKAGYLMNVKSGSINYDKYYIPNRLSDKTNYYYNDIYGILVNTEDYKDFVTIKESVLKIDGLFASLGFGIEINRSSFSIALDFFNTNLETTILNHYYTFPDDDIYDISSVPTVYDNNIEKVNNSKMGFSIAFKYGYSIF